MKKAVTTGVGEEAEGEDERGDQDEEVEVGYYLPVADEGAAGAGDEPEEEEEEEERRCEKGRESVGGEVVGWLGW